MQNSCSDLMTVQLKDDFKWKEGFKQRNIVQKSVVLP